MASRAVFGVAPPFVFFSDNSVSEIYSLLSIYAYPVCSELCQQLEPLGKPLVSNEAENFASM